MRGMQVVVKGGSPKSSRKRGESNPDKPLQDETDDDVLLARRRREANDRYFQHVNMGVLDVVKRLEVVAGALRQVEKESREIWSDSEDEVSQNGEGSVDGAHSGAEGTPGHSRDTSSLTG